GEGVELAVGLDKRVLGDVRGAISVAHHAQDVVEDRLGKLREDALETRFERGVPGSLAHHGIRPDELRPGHRLHVFLRTGRCFHSVPKRARRLICYRPLVGEIQPADRWSWLRSTSAAYSGAAGLTASAVARSSPAITRRRGCSS